MAKVLIIEDSAFQRMGLKKILKNGNYDFIEAVNGREGIEIATNEEYDIILLDLTMPDLSGPEVLKEIKEKGIKKPVIVVTADIQDTSYKQVVELGISDFINKPVSEEKLLTSMEKVLKDDK